MIEKAKPMVPEKPKVDVEDLKRKVGEYKVSIELAREEKELRQKALEIQVKNPKTVKPNFEFENTPEWQEQLVAQWEFDFKKNARQIDFHIEEQTRRMLEVQSEVDKVEKKDD